MNSFGRFFRVSLFGESHGPQLGAVLDGVTPGIPLSEADLMGDIDRRRSGARGTTPRREADAPRIVSGVYEGRTTGAPLTIVFDNGDTRSADYGLFRDIPRPGHADRTAVLRSGGYNDPRGGGHFSGRLTLPLVAAGAVAKKLLGGTALAARLVEVGGEADADRWDGLLADAAADGDSLGGIVECRAEGLPASLGAPFFDAVESLLAHAVFAIPGVRGIEFGDGFAAARMRGSAHNDPLGTSKNGAGGVNGGLTNGLPVVFRVAFKPTSSIRRPQRTLNVTTGEMVTLEIPGRHDVCFALRTPVIVEAVAAIVFADLLRIR